MAAAADTKFFGEFLSMIGGTQIVQLDGFRQHELVHAEDLHGVVGFARILQQLLVEVLRLVLFKRPLALGLRHGTHLARMDGIDGNAWRGLNHTKLLDRLAIEGLLCQALAHVALIVSLNPLHLLVQALVGLVEDSLRELKNNLLVRDLIQGRPISFVLGFKGVKVVLRDTHIESGIVKLNPRIFNTVAEGNEWPTKSEIATRIFECGLGNQRHCRDRR